MEILHVSAECYPVAKAGGLGDVVGALPKYQNKAGHTAKVVMPMYKTKYLFNNNWVVDAKGTAYLGNYFFEYTIIKDPINQLGFDLYLVDIIGLLDREKIYGYDDDTSRFMAFQIAVVSWLNTWQHQPDIVHCHDHHTGLIPFMLKNCLAFKKLQQIPTVFTIHNAQYQGWMGWDKSILIPEWDSWKGGELEWANTINPLASAVKCAWKVTTVSHSYMNELKYNSNGLEALFEYEKGKCMGILNGIDTDVWNPANDSLLKHHYKITTVTAGKKKNKKLICEQFGLNETLPLIIFIGRLVAEKAADILAESFLSVLNNMKDEVSFLVLGSGDPHVEWQLSLIKNQFPGCYHAVIGYNEKLSHEMYAGADFLLMPSRIEPCGLNQMYAMRYGTVPIVRSTGGLQDTVVDMGNWEGFGIRFNYATVSDVYYSINRAVSVYKDAIHMKWMQQHMMQIDHSWEQTVHEYTQVYQSLQ
jgi:starch synthase